LVKEAKIANTFVASSLTKGLKKNGPKYENVMGCTSWVFSSQACRPVHREGFLIENYVTAPEKVEEQVELELGLKILKKYMEFTGICW